MKKLILLILVFTSIQVMAQLAPANQGTTYGNSVNDEEAITLQTLFRRLSQNEKFSGRIKGKVIDVCDKKGCWMKLANESGGEIMVKFADYGFFVPKDIKGKDVVLNGVAKKEVTSVSKLQHYAQDAGKSAEDIAKITKPKEEIVFTAAGVLVL